MITSASPAQTSEWTAHVEAAMQAELLRRSQLLKWAVALSLLVGALAVWLAVGLRGMSWEEISPRLRAATEPLIQQNLAPVLQTQISQGQVQQDMSQELKRLEGELARLRDEVAASRRVRDPRVATLQRRMDQVERALNDALAERAQLDARLDALSALPISGARAAGD